MKLLRLFTLAFFASQLTSVGAAVELPALFGDNMVLQRDVPVNIWGTASPGETVTLAVDGRKEATTKAGPDGRWKAQLLAHKAGGPHELTLTGTPSLTLHNILFGDVWLLTGQSNMDGNSKGMLKPEVLAAEQPKANYPDLRYYTVGHPRKMEPLQGNWIACTPETMPGLSATGYFFARDLIEKLKIPIGLISAPWSGQRSETFTSLGVLEKLPEYKPLKEKWEKLTADYPAQMKIYETVTLPKWQAAADQAKQAGQKAPNRPNPPKGGPDDESRPGTLFERMIAPLIPVTIKGIAWYQGESNADTMADAIAYRVMFPAMINDWRARWGWDMPFHYVQLANFRAVQTEPSPRGEAWPYVRESQTLTLGLPATGMSLTVDLNDDPANIHPKNKVTTGARLAQVALAKVYGQKVPYTGPLYRGMKIEGNRVRVSFDNVNGSLKARGPVLKGFALAGADGKFVWGDAKIDGATVVVSSPQIATPAMVRYDWADNPIGNLYDGADLPAAPFRSDTSLPGEAVVPLLGKVVTLRAQANGKYVTSTPQGKGPLVNNGSTSADAEKFTVIDRGAGFVTLQAKSNGKYAWGLPSGKDNLTIVSSNLGNFEMFELVPLGKGAWALSAESNRKFVTADAEGKKPLVNDSADAGAAQTFEISIQP
ncbi:MAG TPA: sialate O-acetylesterase [Chthoniobacterales bacterium]|nr:sialate O-acetylesterase [Chthoniobacterales bacterium]